MWWQLRVLCIEVFLDSGWVKLWQLLMVGQRCQKWCEGEGFKQGLLRYCKMRQSTWRSPAPKLVCWCWTLTLVPARAQRAAAIIVALDCRNDGWIQSDKQLPKFYIADAFWFVYDEKNDLRRIARYMGKDQSNQWVQFLPWMSQA